MKPSVSLIIPVYNRPQEIEELLDSISKANHFSPFEVLIIEDGSELRCEDICDRFRESFKIKYFFKENTGPGDSRNFGMAHADSHLFIFLDSDCIIPNNYFEVLEPFLNRNDIDCFGGTDRAHDDFTSLQKAIDFSMTSYLTTGGVRGKKGNSKSFQPRSFNMGLSRRAYEATGGFSNLHPGEDPELVMKLWRMGFQSILIEDLYVYHKRRISWAKFALQMKKFGMARVVLNQEFKEYKKATYFFPFFFTVGFLISIALIFFSLPFLFYLYLFYFLTILIGASFKRGFQVGFQAVMTTFIQFVYYTLGFVRAIYALQILKLEPEKALPDLFFDA